MRSHPIIALSAATAWVLASAAPAFADLPDGNPKAGQMVFKTNCVVCHGNTGNGDGPGAAGLTPKPKKFTDAAVMSKINDATRLKAVTEGGASVGASPIMPPFKEALSPEQIRNVLAYVKTLAR